MAKSTADASLKAFFRSREAFRKRSLAAEKTVRTVLCAVEDLGDTAVRVFTRRWDKAKLKSIRVTDEEFADGLRQVSSADRKTLDEIAGRLRRFYETQKMRTAPFVDSTGYYSERVSPLDRVGLYVPGGRAPLVSTALMLGVPAAVAGVPERYLATPPRKDGTAPPLILAAAKSAGVTAVFKMGGAQALAAFAYGTRTVPKVDKIYGPGNIYVTAAKKLLFGDVGVDLLAGPSELVILADETANPEFLAEDLQAQAEHGPDSLSLLLTTSAAVAGAVSKLLRGGSTRRQIFIVAVKTIEDGVKIAAGLAPEHLSLQVSDPDRLASQVGPAGAIFLGSTAVAHGDYIAGPNHTLPVAGGARFSSPLSVEAFFRRSSIIRVRDPDGRLSELGAQVADWEGLTHHGRSLRLRKSGR